MSFLKSFLEKFSKAPTALVEEDDTDYQQHIDQTKSSAITITTENDKASITSPSHKEQTAAASASSSTSTTTTTTATILTIETGGCVNGEVADIGHVAVEIPDENHDEFQATVSGNGIGEMNLIDDDGDDDDSDDEENYETYSYLQFEKHAVRIQDTGYRWFFLFAGLFSQNTLKNHSLSFVLFLYTQRFLIFAFMLFFFMIKFGIWFRNVSWLVLERKYPFTVINYVLWELRWILTYFLSMHLLSHKEFGKFLKRLELPIEKWKSYRRPMLWYTLVVALVLVIIPIIFIMLDVNWFDHHKRYTMTLIENVVIFVTVVLFRLLVLPGFCMLTVILYLLSEHIVVTGKRVCAQRTIGDAERLIIKLRKFIRKTGSLISLTVFVHMFLIFSSSFTTLMSTVERLELTYTHDNNTSTQMHIDLHENVLPLSDLMETNLAIERAKLQLSSSTEGRKEHGKEEVIKAIDIQQAYSVITKLQERQINLMQKIVSKKNSSVTAVYSGKPPNFFQVVMSITESYNKIRIMLDTLLTMLEILLLYMSPLFLISRTDARVSEILNMVQEIDIEQQGEFYAVTSYPLKERLTDLLKGTSGLRICGYKVQFFQTLIFSSFGAFFAIALRGIWKHFGWF